MFFLKQFLLYFLSLTIQAGQCSGVLYGGDGSQLMANIVGLAVIVGWSGGASTAVFSFLRNMDWLRLSEEREDEGTDDNEVRVLPHCTLKLQCFYSLHATPLYLPRTLYNAQLCTMLSPSLHLLVLFLRTKA